MSESADDFRVRKLTEAGWKQRTEPGDEGEAWTSPDGWDVTPTRLAYRQMLNATAVKVGAPTGWLCPRCGTSNAPTVPQCPCARQTRSRFEMPHLCKFVGPSWNKRCLCGRREPMKLGGVRA